MGGAFGGNAKPFRDGSIDGEWNHVTFQGDHFHGHPRTLVCAFVGGDPADPPRVDANQATFIGFGVWNGEDGYTFEVVVEDHGESGRSDTHSITVFSPLGAVVYSASDVLARGNIQFTPRIRATRNRRASEARRQERREARERELSGFRVSPIVLSRVHVRLASGYDESDRFDDAARGFEQARHRHRRAGARCTDGERYHASEWSRYARERNPPTAARGLAGSRARTRVGTFRRTSVAGPSAPFARVRADRRASR